MKSWILAASSLHENSAMGWWMTGLAAGALLAFALIWRQRDHPLARIFAFLAVGTAVIFLDASFFAGAGAERSRAVALRQLDEDNSAVVALRQNEVSKNLIHEVCLVVLVSSAIICLWPLLKSGIRKLSKKPNSALFLALLSLALSGCMRAYDRPEYVEIDTSETGFLIPLEGDGNQQAKFQSEDYLKQRKVAAKRVQIIHRWSQEGRLDQDGHWIPLVRLIKVKRSPVTREWTTEGGLVNGALRRSDKAIWIESADSVGFSMGFTCTAFIPEEEAAQFLYWYPSGSLSEVMDHEVRARIQQVAAEVAAKYPLDILRARKQEIVDAVKKDLITFFESRGVTVTTVGMFGGMTYENAEIQRAIDQTFIAQQLKVVSEAKFEAQKKENERIELEANATAERARREAAGLADARKTSAEGEAQAIREVAGALALVKDNSVILQLRAMEVEKARVEKWDGRYPTFFMGANGQGGSGPGLLFQLPWLGRPNETK